MKKITDIDEKVLTHLVHTPSKKRTTPQLYEELMEKGHSFEERTLYNSLKRLEEFDLVNCEKGWRKDTRVYFLDDDSIIFKNIVSYFLGCSPDEIVDFMGSRYIREIITENVVGYAAARWVFYAESMKLAPSDDWERNFGRFWELMGKEDWVNFMCTLIEVRRSADLLDSSSPPPAKVFREINRKIKENIPTLHEREVPAPMGKIMRKIIGTLDNIEDLRELYVLTESDVKEDEEKDSNTLTIRMRVGDAVQELDRSLGKETLLFGETAYILTQENPITPPARKTMLNLMKASPLALRMGLFPNIAVVRVRKRTLRGGELLLKLQAALHIVFALDGILQGYGMADRLPKQAQLEGKIVTIGPEGYSAQIEYHCEEGRSKVRVKFDNSGWRGVTETLGTEDSRTIFEEVLDPNSNYRVIVSLEPHGN